MNLYYENLVHIFAEKVKKVIGSDLTGIYLHGSMAMGCFNPNKSDIDIIVVIEKDISVSQKLLFMKEIAALNEQAPAKGLEISVVKREYCDPFLYPTPFELHFSPVHLDSYRRSPHDYVRNMNGVDKDLAAHFTVINNYGRVIFGESINKVFGEVSKECYIDSVYCDIRNAASDILTDPIYVILNLCRTLAYVKEGKCLSKADGGRYAAENAELDTTLVKEALDCYLSDREMTVSAEKAVEFAEKMLYIIFDGE